MLIRFHHLNGDLVTGVILIYDNDDNCNSTTTILDLCDDMDGDGITKSEGDCDDNNDQVFPGNIEVCDGIDNDCNGLIDDEDPNIVRAIRFGMLIQMKMD